jgi:uncharacterized protein (DUF1499 family)
MFAVMNTPLNPPMNPTPKSTKLTLAMMGIVPLWFVIAAFGTKFGVWDWKFGLLTMTISGGPILLGILGLVALVSLVLAIRARPRRMVPLAVAVIALFAVGVVFGLMASLGGKAAANPISDIATDTGNPPAFSAAVMAERAEGASNPVNDYQTPIGQIMPYKDRVSPDLAVKSIAQIITATSDRPAPLPLGGADKAAGIAAVKAAMTAMGLTDIRADEATGTVEGVATSFWFGFKDDVAARVGAAQIDFRSVSRVGVSDLGANTARINDLRTRTEALLGTAAR